MLRVESSGDLLASRRRLVAGELDAERSSADVPDAAAVATLSVELALRCWRRLAWCAASATAAARSRRVDIRSLDTCDSSASAAQLCVAEFEFAVAVASKFVFVFVFVFAVEVEVEVAVVVVVAGVWSSSSSVSCRRSSLNSKSSQIMCSFSTCTGDASDVDDDDT